MEEPGGRGSKAGDDGLVHVGLSSQVRGGVPHKGVSEGLQPFFPPRQAALARCGGFAT
jgi:hypothetical protein